MTAPRELVHRLLEDPSFQKWATGRASPEIDGRWDAWIAGDDTAPWPGGPESTHPHGDPDAVMREEAAASAAEIIRILEFRDMSVSDTDVDEAWTRFQKRLHARTSASEPGPKGRRSRPANRPGRRPAASRTAASRTAASRTAGSRIGAIVFTIVLVAGAGLWLFTQPSTEPVEITTQAGEQATVTLPDETRIVLNANSRLRYDRNAFTEGSRVVSVDGEALFDVQPAPQRDNPSFRVVAPDGSIRVLGTTFSVAHRGAGTRVVLSEGRVAVDSRLADRDTTFELKPGELVSFDRQTGQVKRRAVNPRVYTSWASGTLVFDNTPLPEVVARIEATYDVQVVVQNPGILDRVVSGSVENDLVVLINGLAQILDRPSDRTGDRSVIR